MRPLTAINFVWLAWAVTWWAAAFWSRPAARTAGDQTIYRVILLIGVILLFLVPQDQSLPLWHIPLAVQWLCVTLAAAGFAFCWWARLHLGVYWSANVGRKAEHKVIDTGPYGLVRHPIYTGIILAGFATAALKGSAAAFAGASVMTLSWYVKARLEERFLRQEMGAAYDAYASRTRMLIPFIL